MRSRVPLFVLLFAIGAFALPLTTYAGIPFFGPIIPPGVSAFGDSQTCPASWGMLITVVNNIISFLLTLVIVFVAPLMIAYSGFLYVVNPVNSGGMAKAKSILTNTIVGIVIALAGWMIVDAIMVVLYNPGASSGTTKLEAWASLITSGGIDPCIKVAGALKPAAPPTVGVVPGACSVSPLTTITDRFALQMEAMNGNAVIWDNTNPQLQACANKFIKNAGSGRVTSAYRPQSYQTHLWEIQDRWCTQSLKSNSDSACSSLKDTVSKEVTTHFGTAWNCGAVARDASTHGKGTGVDISGIDQVNQQKSSAACLKFGGYNEDPWHYTLDLTIPGCSCQ